MLNSVYHILKTHCWHLKLDFVMSYTVSHFSYAPLIKCKIIQKRNMIFLF